MDQCVKLIVGLGNPGIEYQFTPHNLGFLTIDRIASNLGVEVRNRQCRALTARALIGTKTIDTKTSAGEPVLLAKPETYMNLSGLSVVELVAEYQVDVSRDLIVIYDELDLPLGTIRIRQRGSSAGHNGMESVLGALGTDEILRIRLGIAPDRKVADGVKYVLTPFRKAQDKMVDEILDTAVQAVEVILKEGPAAAMNRFNRKNEQE
jgi:peptidyl-tRNA hydrolase, PTH1 family